MNKELYDLAEWSLKTAKAAGADDARVSISGERFVEISYRERKPENIKEASKKALFRAKHVRFAKRCTENIYHQCGENDKAAG
jgi:hypothetical protein